MCVCVRVGVGVGGWVQSFPFPRFAQGHNQREWTLKRSFLVAHASDLELHNKCLAD